MNKELQKNRSKNIRETYGRKKEVEQIKCSAGVLAIATKNEESGLSVANLWLEWMGYNLHHWRKIQISEITDPFEYWCILCLHYSDFQTHSPNWILYFRENKNEAKPDKKTAADSVYNISQSFISNVHHLFSSTKAGCWNSFESSWIWCYSCLHCCCHVDWSPGYCSSYFTLH